MAGGHHRPTHFWYGLILGVLAGFAFFYRWGALFVWHAIVALLIGVAFGIFAREYGDRFWHEIIRWFRFLWHW